jgi:DNA-directed RNA polymerase alpha subunit
VDDECAVECAGLLEARVLRRALLTLVHVLACSSVRIRKNTSDHEDWIIAHRCGKLAITGDGTESTATLQVKGRTAFGRDLQFRTNEAVSPASLDAPLVVMRGEQEIHAELHFTRGTPMEHARYHCVVAPAYAPEVLLSHAPTREQRKRLSEYVISRKNVCTRRDGRPCRIEVLRELLPEGQPSVLFGERTTIAVESHGQMAAAVCVQRALRAVLEECDALVAAVKACDTASTGKA